MALRTVEHLLSTCVVLPKAASPSHVSTRKTLETLSFEVPEVQSAASATDVGIFLDLHLIHRIVILFHQNAICLF